MNKWLIVGSAILLVVLLFASVLWGCTCKDNVEEEGFENKTSDELPPLEPIAEVPSSILTAKEKELFEDLKNSRLSDKDVQSMVKSGQLTETMIEKFLANLGNAALNGATSAAAADNKPNNYFAQQAAPQTNEDKIEGFTGSAYARW